MTASPRLGSLLQSATERLRASGSPSPRLDAELLLGHVLGTDRAGVLAHPEAVMSTAYAERLDSLVARREKGEPVAYIRGIKEFYGLVFMVDSRALIPRPETEVLVEIGLARIRDVLIESPRQPGTPPLLVADVGTGSGAIAVSLAVECRRRGYADHVRFVAADADGDALDLARENGVGHGVADLVEFAQADLVPPSDRRYDLIVANLPYIPSAQVPLLPVAASFEPARALDGGPDGLALIGRLIERLPTEVAAGGRALLEIGDDQPNGVRRLAETALPAWSVTIHPDLASQPRVAELGPPPAPPRPG